MRIFGAWRHSLATTFAIRASALVSLIILGVMGYALYDEYGALTRELQSRAMLRARYLAEESVDPILREDDYALFKLVQFLRKSQDRDVTGEERILYAMVLDLNGQALAHTEAGKVYTILQDARTREALARLEPSVAAGTPDGEPLFDVAVPVRMRGQAVGLVRVGISRLGVMAVLRGAALKALAVFFFLMLLAMAGIWQFSRRITRPVQRLRDAALAVQAGDLTRRVAVDRSDEIGQLASAFNAMTAELARSGAELQQKEEMRARLLQKVITAQEDERKRIARELHDETSQALTSLMVGLKVLEDRCELEAPQEMVAYLRTLTGKTLETVHDLALQLRPSVLDDLGLVPALRRLASDFQRASVASVTFETNLAASPRLPATLETTFYRIAQEGLTNVARHAGATAVSLLLEVRSGLLQLILEDNGRGFEPTQLDGRGPHDRCLGLFGMRERAALAGGTLAIEASPGHGTTLFVKVPLPMELTDARLEPNPDPARR